MTQPDPIRQSAGALSVLAPGQQADGAYHGVSRAVGPYPAYSTGVRPPAVGGQGAGFPGEADSSTRLVAALIAMVALLVAMVGGGAAALHGSAGVTTRAAWVAALNVPSTRTAIQALLDRRAAAVLGRDKAAFMAEVDTYDKDFVRRQEVLYDNLVTLPLGELTYVLEPSFEYAKAIVDSVAARFNAKVYAPGVTVRYTISGVDSRTVTTPWVPVFGRSGKRWVIADEASQRNLPYGSNGQIWDAGPIAVVRSPRVVAAFSAEDTGRADYLLQLAEQGLDRVGAVRHSGWDGKVLVTVVQDRRIFDAYFANSPDRVAQVAAIAVPYYDRVLDWHANAVFATTRVVFNPQQLSAQPEELAHDLAHEFTHAAMGPVTVSTTPRWLVEGFAEYVSYKQENMTAATLRRNLRGTALPSVFPEDGKFYADASNYITSWLACRMIAEKYGEARLIALYEAFQRVNAQDVTVASVLGVSLPTLTSQWRDYMQRKLA